MSLEYGHVAQFHDNGRAHVRHRYALEIEILLGRAFDVLLQFGIAGAPAGAPLGLVIAVNRVKMTEFLLGGGRLAPKLPSQALLLISREF